MAIGQIRTYVCTGVMCFFSLVEQTKEGVSDIVRPGAVYNRVDAA